MPAHDPGTVLVADDQASARGALTRLLGARGFRVLQAADGRQALATARREKPDVIIMDVVMPHLDGIDACRELRADRSVPYIPVLFHSRRDQLHQVVAALNAGGDGFVTKDVAGEELVARIQALVRIRRLIAGGAAEPQGLAADGVSLTQGIEPLFARAARDNAPLSLLIIEPEAGRNIDQRQLARQLAAVCAGAALVAPDRERAVGVVLRDTHFGGALAMAEHVWRAHAPERGSGGLAVGVACYPNRQVSGAGELVAFARAALERARAEGPAHICLYQHQAYIFRPE